MDNQLWNVFRETGDPMGYLLYKADGKKEQKNLREKVKREGERPSASL